MSTNFPTSLDALTNPTSGDHLNSPTHSAQHANANDAIEALEAKVGVDGSAVTTSLDYKVSHLAIPFDPLTAFPWYASMWANDPGYLGSFTANTRGDGTAMDKWHIAGSGGFSGDLDQGTSNARPIYSTNATKFNRRSALAFDGTNDQLLSPAFASPLAAPHTWVCVMARNGSDGGGNPRVLSDTGGNSGLLLDYPTAGHFGLYAGGAGIAGPVYDANAHLLVGYVHSGATGFIAVDGGAPVTGTTGTQAAVDFSLGAGSGGFSNVSIAFGGLYPGDFTSDANYATFKRWVAAYYGLTIA